MAKVKAFSCIRPRADLAAQIAALPYDVYTRMEAKVETEKNPLSFLRIDRAETQSGDEVDTYDQRVYQKAHDLLWGMVADGSFVRDEKPCYYIYELTMQGRSQTGLVACAAVDDYVNGVVKKHENTRADKEADRIRHVDICNAQTGPIFLTYRSREEVNIIIEKKKQEQPLYDFTSDDGVVHRVWIISEDERIRELEALFADIDSIYIADGHHRAASAVKTGLKRRKEKDICTGEEEFNYFLSVLFPDEQLKILDYNRMVKDLNGLSREEFLEKLSGCYNIEAKGKIPYRPEKKGETGMVIGEEWYCLTYKKEITDMNPVKSLDVEILQKEVLTPLLGIEDPKTDPRISFLGGIWGIEELARRTAKEYAVGFAMYPTSMDELLAVADAGELMPPKSTWFEPKLRSGLFIHEL